MSDRARTRQPADRMALYATLAAAALLAEQVGSKAARDALYLSNFPVTTLPWMLIGSAVFTLVMVGLTSRAMLTHDPSWLVPRALLGSAMLLLGEWGLAHTFPRLTAVLVYLHVASLGALLISGFWSVVNETFDPRSAKRHIGRITVAATLGGLLGGVLAERVAVMLPIIWILPLLAALHFYSALTLFRVRPPAAALERARETSPERAAAQGLQTLKKAPYLRNLALLVFVATAAAALLDYVFKARAVASIDSGAALLRFFAIFHTATGVGTFLVQGIASRIPMERLSLAARVNAYPLTIGAGAAAALAFPGIAAAALARGAQQVLQNSLFRSGYEVLFTPVAPRDKRATKAIVDVGCERAGDAVGGGCVRLLLVLPAAMVAPALLLLAAVLALVGYAAASRLRRGYVRQLEQRLLSGVYRIDLHELEDPLNRSMVLPTLATKVLPRLETGEIAAAGARAAAESGGDHGPRTDDVLLLRIEELRSGDPARVAAALETGPIGPELAPHVVPLLAWDAIYPYAARALGRARPQIEGLLVDRLLDASEEFAIRRRIPALLAESSSRVVIEGLLQGLLDPRFEVRFRSGHALARIHDRDASVPFDRHRVFAIALRETRVDRSVWESQRLLDGLEAGDENPIVDEYLRQRANRSLEHVFTVLSLALDKKPLQVAFKGLHTDDPILRGTALEYLESALPQELREHLWPFLEDRRGRAQSSRTRDEILDSLMNSHQSIEINLANLRKKLLEDA